MKLRSLKIKNFRSIHNLTLSLNDFTILIGKNNSGKTSILDAIKIVFKNIDHNTIKTIRYWSLPEDIRRQMHGLWFFKNYHNPAEIQALVELDSDEIDEELKEFCKLKEEIKAIRISVLIEFIRDKELISWKLDRLDILGFVSKTPKKALQLLEELSGKVEGNLYTYCRVVDSTKIVNSAAFNKVLNILNNKIHVVTPFYIGSDFSITNIGIEGAFRKLLVPKEFTESLKSVLESSELKDFFYKYINEVKGVMDECTYVDPRSKTYERELLSFELFGGGDQSVDYLIASLLSMGKGQVFLIEEPETHMHPAYIRGLAHALEEIIKERNIQLIIVTQSPEFITSIKDKTAIVGVRKEYVKVHAISKPATKVYKPYRGGDDKYIIESIAHELGIPSGHFFYTDVVILVEGRSDKILFQHFIRLLESSRGLMNFPKVFYDILEYGSRRLKTLLEVFHKWFKIKTFVIADNDDQGRKSIDIAYKMGLRGDKEVFMLSKKDILCYIPPNTLYNILTNLLLKVLKINKDRLNKIGALNILEEIKAHGLMKNGSDLLRKLVYVVNKEIPKEVLITYGWGSKDLYHTLKPFIAEEAVKLWKDVPSEVKRILHMIDIGVKEAI